MHIYFYIEKIFFVFYNFPMKNIKKFLTLLTIVLFVSCTTEVVKYIYIDPTTGEQISPDKLPNYDNPSPKPDETPTDKPTDNPVNPAEYIRTTSSTISLPKCPENTKFDMIAISFTDGRTEDDLILGEDQYCGASSAKVEIPYPTTVKPFKMSKYMVSYNTWYHVYQWAIKNGYNFIGKGCEGMYTNANNAGVYYKFNEGGEPKVEEMPVAGVNWRDAVVWCNALSEMTGLTPVYCADENFSTPLKDSTQSTTEFADKNWDMTPGKIDNPCVNKKANGFRLPYTAEWEYAARKKKMELALKEEIFPEMTAVHIINIKV